MKRDRILRVKEGLVDRGEIVDEAAIAEQLPEQEVRDISDEDNFFNFQMLGFHNWHF